jgi:hypothetical protein
MFRAVVMGGFKLQGALADTQGSQALAGQGQQVLGDPAEEQHLAFAAKTAPLGGLREALAVLARLQTCNGRTDLC